MEIVLCVLLWPNDGRERDLIAYEDRVLPLLADHGGRVIQRARSSGEGNDPLEVHVLSFPDEDAFNAYMRDDRRVALTAQRDEAIARTEVIRVTLIDG
jgi:uncharacterized protein (DUF1330 family)